MRVRARHAAILLPVICTVSVLGCRRVAGEGDPVDVTYAASLVGTMQGLERRFTEHSGRRVLGDPRGSLAGAHLIREGLYRRDVYITADPATLPLLGEKNPGWAVAFARSEIVIAYAAGSRHAAALDSAVDGSPPWHEVVLRPGFRLGRTDPEIDPKGYRAIFAFQLAERHYDRPGLADRILGGPAGAESVFPEEHLSARVETGSLDAGIFYLAEARAHGLHVIRLPPLLAQTASNEAGTLGALGYRTSDGRVYTVRPIVYAATVPKNGSASRAGVQFIRFLVGKEGRAILLSDGYLPELSLIGDENGVPPELAELLGS